jgi:D-alanine-D-alanine ligase
LPAIVLEPGWPTTRLRDPAAVGATGPLSAPAALEGLRAERPAPVVFPALHGPFGEDGGIQALLGSVGLVYCGSGPASSAVGMDKTIFKRICASMELPVLPWIEIRALEHAADASAVEAELLAFARGLPDQRLVLKPSRMGSSVGITIVRDPADPGELRAAISEALRHDDLALAEPYLDHPRELEVSVLGNTRLDLVVYGPGEIVPGREFYDYEAKYRSTDSRVMTHPDPALPAHLRDDIRSAAADAYLAVGARGFARVDFMLARGDILFLSEINTIPGFTPISLFPRLCEEGGLDFAEVCGRIVGLALEQAGTRPRRRLAVADLP